MLNSKHRFLLVSRFIGEIKFKEKSFQPKTFIKVLLFSCAIHITDRGHLKFEKNIFYFTMVFSQFVYKMYKFSF